MIVIAAWLVPASAAEAAPAAPARSSRVLIVSFPTLTWDDLDPTVTPTLSRFLDQAAVADLATRADRQPANLGAAYVTIGAGARSAGDEATDGEGLEVGERFGTVSAGDVYRQRTAGAPGHGIVNLGIARIEGANASLLYGAVPGALGDTLTRHGYTTEVVANGDGVPPDASRAGSRVRPLGRGGAHGRARPPGPRRGLPIAARARRRRTVRPATGSARGRRRRSRGIGRRRALSHWSRHPTWSGPIERRRSPPPTVRRDSVTRRSGGATNCSQRSSSTSISRATRCSSSRRCRPAGIGR